MTDRYHDRGANWWFLGAFAVVGYVCVMAGIAYVAIHFIMKFW